MTEAVPTALIILDKGKAQSVLRCLVSLIFNFRYGLRTVEAGSFEEARQWMGGGSPNDLRCVVLIQKQHLGTDVGISAFNLRDNALFALVPKALAPRYMQQTKGLRNGHVVTWETAFRDSGRSLGQLIGQQLEKSGQTRPLAGLDAIAVDRRHEFVERRLKGIDSLPSLPGTISRILELLADPEVTAEQLERVVLLDPPIVQRLFSVASSPAFAGRGGEITSVRDAIVRLGLREVAAVVMQASLAGGFLRSQESLIDYKRFWAHSVACALTAHKIVSGDLLPLKAKLQFHDYWTTCLLHDVGKLVIGVYFWDHFALLMGETISCGGSFRETERRLGDVAGHDEIGHLVLTRSHLSPLVCDTVRDHHDLPEAPNPLVCLLHVANVITKGLGLSFPMETESSCHPHVLTTLGNHRQTSMPWVRRWDPPSSPR
ncbi:MAG TPA: HDOD domain-containing protein [Candidatus Latescibacteria bacterium]|nr:HDOD domain-containing protein [Candidatus Latescibacterota bacterium]HJP32827.1 HDOD domain-containing protein [Candidatus Latescibacterota bacterium]